MYDCTTNKEKNSSHETVQFSAAVIIFDEFLKQDRFGLVINVIGTVTTKQFA